MTEMEKLNKETEESNMDYVDDPADDYPKEGWFSKFKSKSKTVGKKIGKGAAIAAVTGAATAAAGVIACKLTGSGMDLRPRLKRNLLIKQRTLLKPLRTSIN